MRRVELAGGVHYFEAFDATVRTAVERHAVERHVGVKLRMSTDEFGRLLKSVFFVLKMRTVCVRLSLGIVTLCLGGRSSGGGGGSGGAWRVSLEPSS